MIRVTTTGTKTVRTLKAHKLELAVLVAMSTAAACAMPQTPNSDDPSRIGTSRSALTSAAGQAAAQRAMDFLVPDAVAFTQANNCLSCHHQPDVLIATSIAAQLLPDVTLNTSTTNGTGYIANLVVNTQEASGRWTNGGSQPQSFSGEAVWALAGYARAGGTVSVLPSLRKGILWEVPLTSTTTFPSDSAPYAGQTVRYFANDYSASPQMFDWYLPTAQSVFATRALLDLDTGLTASNVSTLSALQTEYTQALEGTTMRALTTSTVQQLSLTAIALAESGRANSSSATSIANEILARQTGGSGWADTRSPDGALHGVNALTTGEALYALCRLGVRPRANATAGAGLDWLVAGQNGNGSWTVPTHDASVSTSWALLSLACASNPRGTAQFEPLTSNGSPSAPSSESFTSTLNVTNTSSDNRTATIAVTGGPSGASINVQPTSIELTGDASGTATVTIQLPPGLPASTSYPFTATVTFSGAGNYQTIGTYTVAIGATPDPVLTRTTTTWATVPAIGTVGTTLALRASVAHAQTGAVSVGQMRFAIDSTDIATVSFDGSSENYNTQWAVPSMAFGHHTLHAYYQGSSSSITYAPSFADIDIDIEPPPPLPPSVMGFTDSGSADGTYNLHGNGGHAGDVITVTANGVVVGTTTVQPDGTWGMPTIHLGPGVYIFRATATNHGGTGNPLSYTSTVVPSAPTVTGPTTGGSTGDSTVRVSGTAQPGATVQVIRDGQVVGTTTADEDGRYGLDVPLQPGPNAFTVKQTVGGAVSTVSNVMYNQTPAAPTTVPPPGAMQGTSTYTARGTTVPGATVTVLDNGMVIGTAIAGPDGSYAIPVTLKSGTNSITVQTSVAGVPGSPSSPVSVRYDGDAPVIISAPPAVVSGSSSNGASASVSWAVPSVYDEQDGALPMTCDHQPGEQFNVGSTTVTCTATDSVGNTTTTRFKVVVASGKRDGASITWVPVPDSQGGTSSSGSSGCSTTSNSTSNLAVFGGLGLALAGLTRRRRQR